MDGQLSLFGAFDSAERSLARKTDPRTSKDAVPSDSVRITAAQIVLHVMLHGDTFTANEAARTAANSSLNTTGTNCESFRKRIRELVDAGRIEAIGERRCDVTGKVATVYRIT